MPLNLDGKTFTSKCNTQNGEVDSDTVFHYHQNGDIVWAEYAGGKIIKGSLVGKLLKNGHLDLRYHHLNNKQELMSGKCISIPEILQDGRLILKENWQWLSGGNGSGYSEVIEKNI